MRINTFQVRKGIYVCVALLSLVLGFSKGVSGNLQGPVSDFEDNRFSSNLPKRIEEVMKDLEGDNYPFFPRYTRSGIIGDPQSKPSYGELEGFLNYPQKTSPTLLRLHREMINSLINPNDPALRNKLKSIMKATQAFNTRAVRKYSLEKD